MNSHLEKDNVQSEVTVDIYPVAVSYHRDSKLVTLVKNFLLDKETKATIITYLNMNYSQEELLRSNNLASAIFLDIYCNLDSIPDTLLDLVISQRMAISLKRFNLGYHTNSKSSTELDVIGYCSTSPILNPVFVDRNCNRCYGAFSLCQPHNPVSNGSFCSHSKHAADLIQVLIDSKTPSVDNPFSESEKKKLIKKLNLFSKALLWIKNHSADGYAVTVASDALANSSVPDKPISTPSVNISDSRNRF